MDGDKFRKITEGLLSSVLISAKNGVQLHRLAREFKEVTLSDIPLEKLGYPSLELYIRAIPHCARIETDNNGVIVVKGVPNESNKHIAKLVSGQKKNKKTSAVRQKPSRLASSRGRGGFVRSKGLNIIRKSTNRPVAPRFAKTSLPLRTNLGGPWGYAAANVQLSLALQSRVGPQFPQLVATRPTDPLAVTQCFGIMNNHFQKSSSAPNFQQGVPQIMRNVHKMAYPKSEGNQGYQLPPRMQRQQQQQQNRIAPKASDSEDEVDLRQVINERKKNKNIGSDERGITINIKNDKFGQILPGDQDLEDLRSKVFEFLEGYKNGIWARVFFNLFKKKYNNAPPNLLEIIKTQMCDKVEVKSTVADDRYIIGLKKEPLIFRMAFEDEKPAARRNETEAGDIRIVVKSNPLDNKENIAAEPSLKEEEGEEVFIKEQEIPGIGETFSAYVCHVDTIDRFFVQKDDSKILDLSNEIQQYYKIRKDKDMIQKPKIGRICCAYYIDQWYRARIIFAKLINNKDTRSLSREGRKASNQVTSLYDCKVLYIDYGNMELVQSDMIRILKPEFCNLPAQAIQCTLNDVTPEGAQPEWSEEAINYFRKFTESDCYTINVVDSRDRILDVKMEDNDGNSVADALADQGFAISKTKRRAESLPILSHISTENQKSLEDEEEEAILSPKSGILQQLSSLSIENEENIDIVNVELPKGECLDILVSAVNSLTEISAILLGNEYKGRLTILEAGMQTYYDCEKTDELETIEQDCVYAAFYEEAWYRVRVTDVRDDDVEIYFVDRGDNGKVNKDDLRKLHTQFKRLPMQAIDLTLINLPESNHPDHIQVLSDVILGKEFVAMLNEGPPEYTLVELFDTSTQEDVNINEKIAIELNLHEDQSYEQILPKPFDQCDAFVSHISDSGIFNIVLPGAGLQKLDELVEDLTKYHSKGAKAADLVNTPEMDKIVCTKWKEDGCLYRVKITCIMAAEKKVEVEFIDYGNRDIISYIALRKIPEHLRELKTLPPQTMKCKLTDCPDEAKELWKYGLATRLTSELKTETVVVKVTKEETDEEMALIEILKIDPVDPSKYSSISVDIASICTSIRENKSSLIFDESEPPEPSQSDTTLPNSERQFVSRLSSSGSSEFHHDTDPHVQHDNTTRSFESQVSLASTTLNAPASKPGIMINNAKFLPLQINNHWCIAHVTSVRSPSAFYFQIHDHIPALINLMEEMEVFYKDSNTPFDDCQIGDICAAFLPEDDNWYRGVVRTKVEIDEEDQIGIFLADYGGTKFVSSSELRKLDMRFQSLPLQAVKGSLTDIAVPVKGKWPQNICEEFQKRILNSVFYIRIHGNDATYPVSYLSTSNERFAIAMYDTSRDVDVLINDSFGS